MTKQEEMNKKRKPNASDWDKITGYYLRGESMEYIMDKIPDVRLSETTIKKRMVELGIDKKRNDINNFVVDRISQDVTYEKEKNVKACLKAYKKGLDIIQDLLKSYKEEMSNEDLVRRRCTAYNMDMLMSGISKIQKGFDVAYKTDNNGNLVETQPEVLVIEGADLDKI